jgi:hypothetical protein
MRVQQGSYTCSTIPMERIGTVKVMYRATPVVRARVKAKTIYQSGFVVQLQCRWQGIGVVVYIPVHMYVCTMYVCIYMYVQVCSM